MTMNAATPSHSFQPQTDTPLVSVCIAAYQHKDYISECIDSALAQTYKNLEIILADDASSDGTAQIIQSYVDRFPGKIKAVFQVKNRGASHTMNQAMSLARGEFIAWLGSDDRMHPGRIARQLEYLENNPQCVCAFSHIQIIDNTGQNRPGAPLEIFFNTPTENLHHRFLAGNSVNAPSGIARTTALQKSGNFSPLLHYVQDYDLWVRLLEQGEVNVIPEVLTDYRVHGKNLSLFENKPPTFQAKVETAAVIHRAAQLWPLSSLSGPDNDISPAQSAQLQLALALQLARVDQHFFQRPLITTSFAYELVIRAAENDPELGAEPKRLLERWLEGGDAPDAIRLFPLTAFDPSQSWGITVAPPGMPPLLRQWMDARKPSLAEQTLIQEKLQQDEKSLPSITVLVRSAESEKKKAQETLQSLAEQSYPHVYAAAIGTGANALEGSVTKIATQGSLGQEISAINEFVTPSANSWVMMVDAGTVFTSSGLLRVALELLNAPECRAVYADELVQTDTDSLGSLLRPGFNLDMFLSCPAGLSRHWLFRHDAFLRAGGLNPQYSRAPEFELLLRLIEEGGIDDLGHVSEPLLVSSAPLLANNEHEIAALEKHLRMRGYGNATVDGNQPGRYRIDYGHVATPVVSIIIPTKDQFAMLERCVSSLLEKTAYQNYEILLVDNNSTTPAACAWLNGLEKLNDARIRVLRYPHPFNYSAINNMATREARGEYLVLLNNDTAILRGDWLDAMLNHAQRPEVGIVGAKLLYPNGTVQHAGVVLGLRGPAEHPFAGLDANAAGYMQRLEIDQNYNAVTGACLMVRRTLYEEVGGLDEQDFKVSYNDVDLCLKVREAGYLIVWTPHAVLLHEGSVSQKQVDTAVHAAKAKRFADEQDALYHKWLPILAHDTAYNQNLSLQGAGFELETDLSLNWNPLTWRPLPVVLALPADRQGCGHYRIIHPAQAMTNTGIADVRLTERYYSPVEMERLQPDSWILQRQVSEEQIELLRRHSQFTKAFKVAELDDYLPNLPMKNAHRSHMPKDVLRAMRRSVALADRFVVSTEPLAEALAGLSPDTRVVPNRLPPNIWRGLKSQRRLSKLPRVGWAGGASHQGDLELLSDVVKALADEVDWVFFGMCTDQIKPYLHEFHGPISIDRYPKKLAALNLDLALAPLEQNLFNECKSNLRLLEYGACSYPVVCSDVGPYRANLPVTRVKNRFKDWVDAIRMHIHDMDETARAGDRLKAAVEQDWMLEGKNLDAWLKAWLPG